MVAYQRIMHIGSERIGEFLLFSYTCSLYRDFKFDYNYNTITHCKVIIMLGEHGEEATSEGRPGTSYPPRNEEVSSEGEGEGQR